MSNTIALVGSETLLGKEVREVLGETELGEQVRLVAALDEEPGKLTEIGGAPTFLAKLVPESLEDAAVVVLAGSPESTKQAMEANPSAIVIDLTYAMEDDPEARVRAPMAETEPGRSHDGPQIVAHPASVAIAMILRRVHESFPLRRSIIHIFEPASERGVAGVEELQQQTLSLLAFKPLEKKVFDTQVSFAMLPQLGQAALLQLQDIEERIERHLASLLNRMELDQTDAIPMPSLRLIQAPVFHGYSFSFWLEFDEPPAAADLEDALSQDPFDLRTSDHEPPNNVGVAGQSGITIGSITSDRNNGDAYWLWAAVDNLRVAAENAALIAAEIV